MLNQKRLKELLDYDPLSGIFTWKVVTSKCINVGDVAGTIQVTVKGKKYITVGIDYKLYTAHRLAFLYMEGEFPPNQVDHDDGNGLHNWWSNLNHATPLENGRNCRLNKHNKSGFNGVYQHKKNGVWDGRWRASIRVAGKSKHLGLFVEWDDAVAERKAANVKYGFHQSHGDAREL